MWKNLPPFIATAAALFPVKISPCTAQLEQAGAALKLPLTVGQWGKQQPVEKEEAEEKERGHVFEHGGEGRDAHLLRELPINFPLIPPSYQPSLPLHMEIHGA